MADKNNEPAFPLYFKEKHEYYGEQMHHHKGMTLRDHFASKAMQGILANSERIGHDEEAVSKAAYRISDAMLKERAPKNENENLNDYS